VLLASGLIVGESLFGVLLAGLIVSSNNPAPLAVVGDNFEFASVLLGGLAFVVVVIAMYVSIARVARGVSKDTDAAVGS